MKLELENGTNISVSTRDDVTRTLMTVGMNGNNFAVLSNNQNFYIQTTGTVLKGFLLEYRNGSEEELYYSKRKDIPYQEMVEIFLSYYDKKTDWQKAIKWERSDADFVKKTPRKLVTQRNAIILFTISLLFFLGSQLQKKQTEDLSRHLGQTTGKIMSVKRQPEGRHSHAYYATVRFLANGKEYIVQNRLETHKISTGNGEIIPVFYDNRDPASKNFFYEYREAIWRGYYFLILSSAACALTGVLFFIICRLRKPEDGMK